MTEFDPAAAIDTRREQRALRLSIAVTIVTGLVGVAGGLLTGSRAIMFDGMYSFIDVILTIGSLAVLQLLHRGSSRRFQYGYWHLEVLVQAFGGAILAIACIYAVINATQGLLSGGNEVAYDLGLIWAALLCIIGLVMGIYMQRRAVRLQSRLLLLDSHSWLIGSLLSLALLIGYGVALAFGDRPWVPLVDSSVLLVIALAMLPIPLATFRRAARDVLEVAPQELDRKVRAVMDELVSERGFLAYSSHVSQVGRARFVEIHILVPPDFRVDTIAAVDRMRHQIADRLGASWPQFWLTVDLTADPDWI